VAGFLTDLIGSSPGIEALHERVTRLLERQREGHRLPPILIEGETGTGKGLLARMLHRAGPRANGPFVDVNCAAIPETLLEAEMFGFERGAFTDARRAKPGLLQVAQRGTIFLDEIGLLGDALQAKLLKALEDRMVRRLGGTRDEPIDVWLITATNEDLRQAIRRRRFREDLYHRLAVVTLTLPPLRERGGDIVQLADHFLRRACADYGMAPRRLTADACAALLRYSWPGNVRELANLMERLALLEANDEIGASALGLAETMPVPRAAAEAVTPRASLDDAVRERLVEVLKQTGWNISRSAALLGISRNTLKARIDKYGLRAPAPAAAAPPAAAPAAPTAHAPAPRPGPPAPLRWQPRRVTLLRAMVSFGEDDDVLDAGRTLDSLIEKVAGFGGRIEGLSPGGLLASFGLGLAEDAPARAGHAAMAMQKAVERAREMGAAPRFKVAIHVTEALVAQGAERQEMDVDARHRAVAALDELLSLSVPEAIVVSELAAPFLERRFDLWEVDQPRRHFVLGGHVRTRLGLGGRVVAFVDHEQELDLLRSRFDAAARGRAQAVGISGAAGIGKSRLLHEFRRVIAAQPAACIEAFCVSYGTAIPYGPMIELGRAVARIKETDPPQVIDDKIRRALAWAGAPANGLADELLHLLGVARDADAEPPDPDAIKTRVFDALRRLCVRMSEEVPVVLALEDVHWIDRTSEEFFTSLVEAMAGARILLVATYRPGYRPPWIDKSYATQMSLPPLAPEDSRALVRSILGVADVDDALMQAIFARAEGNPLFLEELARVVREQGGFSPTMTVPATIQELLLSRIHRLPPEEHQLLLTLAAAGRDVSFSLVAALAEEPPQTVAARLARLQTAEFIYERAAGGDTEYNFGHALMQEVAYESLRPEERRALHERILHAMQRLYPARQDELVERLAHHAFLSGLWQPALVFLRQAGDKALRRSAHREAADFLERALTALDRLPDGRERAEQAIDIRFDLRTALLPLGAFARMTEHLREAERLAEGLGDRRRLAQGMLYAAGHFRLRMGGAGEARRASTRALELAESLDDPSLRVAANAYLGQVLYDCGEYERAIELFARNVALVGDNSRDHFGLPQLPSVHSRTTLAWCLAEHGRFAEGVARGREALAIAETVEAPLNLTVACAGLGVVHLRQGELEAATAVLERGLELTRARNIPLWFPRLASTLGAVHVLAGRVEEGADLLEEALERAEAITLVSGRSLLLAALADARLAAGDVAGAGGHGRHGLEQARAHGELGWAAWCLRALGDVAVAAGDLDEARARYDESAALAAQLGMRPLAALVQLGRGRLAARGGEAADARDLVGGAAATLRALGMPWWAARAEAALALG
jgi:transcriptional regulator with AAA-type ATPase domain/tetratricopeptide (TPR) repeat protein